jgi:hypothetical protein
MRKPGHPIALAAIRSTIARAWSGKVETGFPKKIMLIEMLERQSIQYETIAL